MILIIPTIDLKGEKSRSILAKLLASSLDRNYFSRVVIVGNMTGPVFKLGRRGIEEIAFELEVKNPQERETATWWLLSKADEFLDLAVSEWVVVAEPASLALRGLEHLFPASSKAEFMWAEYAGPELGASTGLWAVRAGLLSMVVSKYAQIHEAGDGGKEAPASLRWKRVVDELPLKKKRFERGEVLTPPAGEVGWTALLEAAFVAVPEWPAREQWSFLHAAYFSTYFADANGVLVHLFEP
jgi:hypothetical protein